MEAVFGGDSVLHRLDNLLAQKEWVQLRREAEGLLRLHGLDDRTLGRVYRAIGRACIGLCQFDHSVQYFEVGLPYALRACDFDTAGYIHMDLGGVHMVLGNRTEARQHLQNYLMHLPRYAEADRFEGRAHFNLGLLYRQDKQYDLAVAAYKQALRCFEQTTEAEAVKAHQNIAWLLLVQGKGEEARTHICLGSSLDSSGDFSSEQLVLQAFLHYVLGDTKTALGYLSPVLEERVKVSDGNRASARWVAAQISMQQKDHDTARRWLQEALSIALAAKETHLVGLCVDLETRMRGEMAEETTGRGS